MKVDIKNSLDVVLIAEYVNEVTGEEERIKPENASLFGLGMVVNKELQTLKCRCLDLDEAVTMDEIIKELGCEAQEYSAAYRKGKRYVEVFGTIDTDSFTQPRLEIKEQGAYVITGGTGGIGFEAAKYLASESKVNLALLSRSRPPVREEWENILAKGEDEKAIRIIQKIREIEQKGSNVECYSADISNEGDVSLALDSIRKKHGRIRKRVLFGRCFPPRYRAPGYWTG
jgi:hypothetical protein